MEPFPFPCHPDRSEAKRRDLRFRGPFVEMFFDGAKPTCPGVPWRNLLCAIRVPRIYRSTNYLPFVILSQAPRRSIAYPRVYGAQSKDLGDACWQMPLRAFRPQTKEN